MRFIGSFYMWSIVYAISSIANILWF